MSKPSSGAARRTLVSKHTLLTACAALLVCAAHGPARAQSKPQLIPNSRKYLDKGLKPASGRSGSVSLTARALVGRDGKSRVELTTGEMDAQATPPGNINKAQLKPLDENGEPLYARNYTGLGGGGFFGVSLDDLHRGQQVQVQANVSGVDGERAAVVTVVETVKLRPDLAPSNISAPERGMINHPVNISVMVREINGEVGARASLVLYADGAEVDRAADVWVDAWGTVSCAFTHTFQTAGTKQLEVRVEGVAPGDYDNSNNAASGSIQIMQPDGRMNYSVQVFDMDFYVRNRFHESRYVNGSLQYERDGESRQEGWRQTAHFYGWMPTAVYFPISVTQFETNDGRLNSSTSLANLAPGWTYEGADAARRYDYKNVWRYDAATGYNFNLYSTIETELATGRRTELTYFSMTREAGDITYYSAGYERFWDEYTGDEFFYSWNEAGVDRFGRRLPMGREYGINISLTSAEGSVYSASPKVILGPFDNTGVQPYGCFDWTQEGFAGRYCGEGEYSQVGKVGYSALSVVWSPVSVIPN